MLAIRGSSDPLEESPTDGRKRKRSSRNKKIAEDALADLEATREKNARLEANLQVALDKIAEMKRQVSWTPCNIVASFSDRHRRQPRRNLLPVSLPPLPLSCLPLPALRFLQLLSFPSEKRFKI